MTMAKLVCSTKAAPVGALITARAAEEHGLQISVSWGEETAYSLPGGAIGATHSAGIARSVSDDRFCFNMYRYGTVLIGIQQPYSLQVCFPQCCGSGMFVPDPNFPSRIQGQQDPDPYQRILSKAQKIVSKLS